MGVVHHSNYLAYMEEARTALLASLGCPYGELEKTGIALPVRKLDLRYWAPAHYEDEIAVWVSVVRVGTASVVFGYEILHAADGHRLTTGKIELACIDLRDEARRPCPLPDTVRRALTGLEVSQDVGSTLGARSR